MINALLLIAAYVVGSIPTGFIIARLCGIDDIRNHGSGNIGATNVARLLGWPFFLLVFFLDTMRAYAFLDVASNYCTDMHVIYLCAVALILGNTKSLFLEFSGGKGVATGFGIVAFLFPSFAINAGIFWLFSLWRSGNAGIASVTMWVLLALWATSAVMRGYLDLSAFLFIFGIASWIIWLHKPNLDQYFSPS